MVNPTTINETRFQYFRQRTTSKGNALVPTIDVQGAFVDGGSFNLNFTNQDNYELQNYTSLTKGTQFIKFGVMEMVRVAYQRHLAGTTLQRCGRSPSRLH